MEKENTKIKVYFDEEWDSCTYKLRIYKVKQPFGWEDKGFYISKEKFDWIKKITKEFGKAQSYLTSILIKNNLI